MSYASLTSTPPTALLLELSGGLVDFGARTLPAALHRLYPDASGHRPASSPAEALRELLGRPPQPGELHDLQHSLAEVAEQHAEPTPGATALLQYLQALQIPHAWLSSLPDAVSSRLSRTLPAAGQIACTNQARPWPAPDSCWQALSQLHIDSLDGCVLVSGNPLLIRAGLNAGCWTIGLASCGPLCGLAPADWQALDSTEQERRRAVATLELYRVGAHSVIDHLEDIGPSLDDISARRLRGEKP